jgi:hypothetical protein
LSPNALGASKNESGILLLASRRSGRRNPQGPELIIVRRDSAANEYHSAAALIETWHRGGIEINGRLQRIRAGDVAILYP